MAQPYSGCRCRCDSDMQSRGWLVCLGCFLPSTAIASETDPKPNDGKTLEHWRQVKEFEHDPPASAIAPQLPASALGNIHDHENDGGTVPTHLTHTTSGADTAVYHGLYVIGGPELECTCDVSNSTQTRVDNSKRNVEPTPLHTHTHWRVEKLINMCSSIFS